MRYQVLGLFLVVTRLLFCIEGPLAACRMNDGQFNTEEGGCLDFQSGAVFSLGQNRRVNYQDAFDYCEQLEESGFSDWRMSTRFELEQTAGRARNYFDFPLVDFFWALAPGNTPEVKLFSLSSPSDMTQENRTTYLGRVVCVRKPADIDGDRVPDSSDRCNLTQGNEEKVETEGARKGCSKEDVYRTLKEATYIQEKKTQLGCQVETATFKTGTGGCVDQTLGLEWVYSRAGEVNWHYRKSACTNLKEGITVQHQDWRLPSPTELLSLAGTGWDLGVVKVPKGYTQFLSDDPSSANQKYTLVDMKERRRADYSQSYQVPSLPALCVRTVTNIKSLGRN